MRRTNARAPPQVCGTSQPADGDGMRVCPYSDFDAAAEECVRGGDIVRFWHAEVRRAAPRVIFELRAFGYLRRRRRRW